MITFLFIALFFFSPVLSWAACTVDGTTRTTASCSRADFNDCYIGSSDGDTIVIKAGDCETDPGNRWTSGYTIGRGLTIRGETGDPLDVKIGRTDLTVFTVNYAAGSAFRISGLALYGRGSTNSMNPTIHVVRAPTGWRIDHNYFEPCHSDFTTTTCFAQAIGLIPLVTGSPLTGGLIDANTFYQAATAHSQIFININGAFGSADYNTIHAAATDFGQTGGRGSWVVIENNSFHGAGVQGGGATDGEKESRFIFRFNDVVNHYVAVHGYDSGSSGVKAMEIYNNRFVADGISWSQQAISPRSGTMLVYNNKIVETNGGNWPGAAILLRNYRSCDETNYNYSTCDGTAPVDQNDDATGWVCHDQPGAGASDASEPIYYWNNCKSDTSDCTLSDDNITVQVYTPIPCTNASGATPADHLMADRDYINQDYTEVVPAYTWFTCPDPIADPLSEGTCNPAIAGKLGYSIGGGEGGDETAPVVTALVIPSSYNKLTVPITTFTCSDAVGVTHYCLVTTNNSANCIWWPGTAPDTFTFSATGSQTVYGFCRDAALNVSESANDSTVIIYSAPFSTR